MDKKALRREIGEKKRAMTAQEIVSNESNYGKVGRPRQLYKLK